MSTLNPYRRCPKCGSTRGVDEFVCANEPNGILCGWDLTGEDIHQDHPPIGDGEIAKPRQLTCPNGHEISEGDLLCRTCNCVIDPSPPTRVIAGWSVLADLPAEGIVRTRHRVRHVSDDRQGVLTLYSPGSEPDPTVYEALQRRVSADHIAALLDFGRWEGQVYEVTEEIHGGSLATLQLDAGDTATILSLVAETAKALAAFMEVGLRHRALSPDKILVRAREPLDLVISGFESGRLSELDLDVESPLEVTRYTAPEAVMGGVASASDWWSLGMIVLGIVTRGECFAGINDQLFLIDVNANGAQIPPGLDPRLDLLLQGLLTLDRSKRWQWKEVRAWLDGESPTVQERQRGSSVSENDPAIFFGGKNYTDVRRFAVDAARALHWSEACDLLAHGRIASWAEDLNLDGRTISSLRDLGQRIEPAVGFRLGVALQMLNPTLPLIFEEAIVNPAWLLNNPAAGYELISGPIPELLHQYGLQTDNWLQRLARRAEAIRARAEAQEITLDTEAFQVLALSTSRAKLTAAWEARRRDFPDASHSSLATILSRKHCSDEDLILLLAASIDQFRSCDEIIQATERLAEQYGLASPLPEDMRSSLAHPRGELYGLLDERIGGFARCGVERCDTWADQFRLERRIGIENILILLGIPAENWAKPPHQEYISSVLEFFEKKISGAILRGQLVRMTIAKTTPRIDMTELALDGDAAATLVEQFLQRTDRTFRLDADVFQDPEGPERRMRNLLNRTRQYVRDTGINGTYIGFPFLLRRDHAEKSAPRLAPILLWPVKVAGQVGSRMDFSLAFDSEGREVLLNPAFTGMFGIEGAKHWQAIANDILSRSAVRLADIMDAFGVRAAPASRTLQPLPRDLSGIAAGEERCICSAVLFHMEFMGQSLVEDLRQLKQRPPENSALEPMLRVGESSSQATAPSENPSPYIPISERFLITHSDPSQEEAIARARSAPGLLIQGPPGTGKSQTIVNLVADCIGRRRSVLIVCQKLPALEVVRKRLVAEGLEARLAMVTDVTRDRQPLLRAIREQLETLAQANPDEARHLEREAATLASQIENLETEIDNQYHASARVDEISGKSYRQILADLIALEEDGAREVIDAARLRRLLSTQTDAAVAELEEACGGVAEQWLEAEYDNSPLSATLQFPHDNATISEFQAAIEDFESAEVLRSSLPAQTHPSLPSMPPESLGEWLRTYRSFLDGLTTSQITATAPLQQLFQDGGPGNRYASLIEALVSLQTGNIRKPLSVEGLTEPLASLSSEQVESLAQRCGQHAQVWLAAHFENSPLQVMNDLPGQVGESEAVQAALLSFAAHEQNRLSTIAKNAFTIPPADPEAMSVWLADHEARFSSLTETLLASFARFGAAFQPDRFGSRYIDVLDRIVAIRGPGLVSVEPSSSLRGLIGPLDESTVEQLADAVSQQVGVWLECQYEETPLRALATFGTARHTLDAFRRDFNALVTAEEARAALGTPIPLALRLHDAEPLAAWLERYQATLSSISEPRLAEVASRLSSFESPALVSAYIRLLRNSLAAGPVDIADEQALARLQALVGSLSDGELAAVGEECTELLPAWRSANLENSSLRVLSQFGCDQHTREQFLQDFECLLSAEVARAALGQPSQMARNLRDYGSLAAWLDSAERDIVDAIAAQPEVTSCLLHLSRQGDLLDRYEKLLDLLAKFHSASSEPVPYVPALETLLYSVPDTLASHVERECMSATGVWLDSAVDPVLLEFLAGFPRDASHTQRLRDGLSQLAASEHSRLALSNRVPPGVSVADTANARSWIAQHGSTLASVSVKLAAFLAVMHSQYDRGPGGKSPAELLFSSLQKLRTEIAAQQLHQCSQPALDQLCETSPEYLEQLEETVGLLRRKSILSFLSPRYRKANTTWTQWVKALPSPSPSLSIDEWSRTIAAARAVQDIYRQAAEVLAGTGLPTPPRLWEQLDGHLKSQMELLQAAHRVRAAVTRCPAVFPSQRMLEKATPAALRRLVEVVQDAASTHEAKVASLAALHVVTPYMVPSWLADRRASIQGTSPPHNDALALGRLVEAVATLDKVQAFRKQVDGYEQLTLRALGALSTIQDTIRRCAPPDRSSYMQLVFRHHRVLARKRRLESIDTRLGWSGEPDKAHVQARLEAVKATRRICQSLNACPAPQLISDAIGSGNVARVQGVLHDQRVAVVQAQAAGISQDALATCERWFSPEWVLGRKTDIEQGNDTTGELRGMQAAFSELEAFQRVRMRLRQSHTAVAECLPVLDAILGNSSSASTDTAARIGALVTAAWCAEQRRVLATHSSLLQSLGECRTQAQQQEALETLLGGRDISEAVLTCPAGGELHASLSSGSAKSLRETLDAFQSAVAYARATQRGQAALLACEPWFQREFLRACQQARFEGRTFLDDLRPITDALPMLHAYQDLRAVLQTPGAELPRNVFESLAEVQTALRAVPQEAVAACVHRLIVCTWLEEKKKSIGQAVPCLRDVWAVFPEQLGQTIAALKAVRDLAQHLARCPEPQDLKAAVTSGEPASVSRTVSGIRAGVEIHHAQQASFSALQNLEPWFRAEWVTARRNAVFTGDSNDAALSPIVAAAPTIAAYQHFRHVLATCEPNVGEVFARLAVSRPVLEALPSGDLPHEVQRAIRNAALEGTKQALEKQYAVLHALAATASHDGHAVLEILSRAKRLHESMQTCPLGSHLTSALALRGAEPLQALLSGFATAAEHGRVVRGSLSALGDLAGYMRPEWIDSATQAIRRNDETKQMVAGIVRALPTLRAYQLFRGRVATLPESAVKCFAVLAKYRETLRTAASDTGDRTVGDLVRQVIRREALLGWKNRLEAQEPCLLAEGTELGAKVDRLRKLDIRLRAVNRQRLSQDMPTQHIQNRGPWTDITRLVGPRAIRLREFFGRGLDLGLLSLRPVWLTTPDVASQLLPLDKGLFDLVIFDEASQMPVEYALPCLYRARSAVVSGDDKQMPPSAFFGGRIETDEGDVLDGDMPDETASDEERQAFEQAWNRREIKDCPDLLHLGDAVLKRATLQVHYRSEYRELIAYSNAAFYQNELGVPVRHPDEAVRTAKPIEYLNVAGVYTKQTNQDEAERVVDFLAALWLEGSGRPPSVGVVTFNLRQAELIEECLEDRAEADEAFRIVYAREQARSDRGEDMSFFVKNVENVQGDERDLILFSTTFGPSEKGVFRRNFGALGHKGGERRLNVAVTRARRKVVIVSSMPIDEVSDMLRTRRKPEKPRDYLQAYLQYAWLLSGGSLEEARSLTGRLVTAGKASESTTGQSDGFLASVAGFIRSLGYEPVNTSHDPILGVNFSITDPATGSFGVGIECDPPRHRLTQRARAREIWRPDVLERAYRVVHRVSPYAWYHDRESEQRRLRTVIVEALSDSSSNTP
jgi:hypothetical protein